MFSNTKKYTCAVPSLFGKLTERQMNLSRSLSLFLEGQLGSSLRTSFPWRMFIASEAWQSTNLAKDLTLGITSLSVDEHASCNGAHELSMQSPPVRSHASDPFLVPTLRRGARLPTLEYSSPYTGVLRPFTCEKPTIGPELGVMTRLFSKASSGSPSGEGNLPSRHRDRPHQPHHEPHHQHKTGQHQSQSPSSSSSILHAPHAAPASTAPLDAASFTSNRSITAPNLIVLQRGKPALVR